MPPPPDPHGIAIMALAAVALFLFSRDRIPMEISALVILGISIIGFELFPYVSPTSSVLMPVGYATSIGGMSTTIVTSTNLLVVQVSAEMGTAPMGMFHFTGIALAGGGLALLYLWLVAPRLSAVERGQDCSWPSCPR